MSGRLMKRNGWCWAAVVMLIRAPATHAFEPLLGTPVNGLQGSIAAARDTGRVGASITVTVTLTNISRSPIDIDPWPGNWFVQVFDERGMILPPATRATDILRPRAFPKTLQPGDSWSTQIEGLRLVTGLPGATLLWEYTPLKPGIYWLGAEYLASPAAQFPSLWTGGLNCRWVQMTVSDR